MEETPQQSNIQPEMPAQSPLPEQSVGNTPPPKSNKKLIIIISLVLLLLVAAAVWYFVFRKDTNSNTNNQSTSGEEADDGQATGIDGARLVYYTYSQDENNLPINYQLYTKNVSGVGETTKRKDLESGVTGSVVHNNQVAVSTEDYTDQLKGTDVWYSSDGGVTYKNILHEDRKSVDTIGYQITSMAFSEDGSSLLVAGLPDQGNNTVREINLSDGKSKDVYKSENNGVFLVGYNKSTGQIVFTEGCYNCDGNTNSELLAHDIEANTNRTLLKIDTYISATLSNDATKILVSYGTLDNDTEVDGIGMPLKAPYTLEQIVLSSGVKTKLLTSDAAITGVTYTNDSNEPVYYTGNKIIKYSGGKPITIFESEGKAILNVYYATNDDLVFDDDGKVAMYNATDKAYTKLLDDSDKTMMIGLAVKQP